MLQINEYQILSLLFFCTDESAEALLSIKNGGFTEVNVKSEIMEDEMDISDDNQNSNNNSGELQMEMETEEEPLQELGPALLGLQRVGTKPPPKPNPPQPVQVLNRRGMPARIRKKNKLFYDDILVNHPHHR